MINHNEPNRTWQDQQYQRLLRNYPTAFAELCERALPHLVSFLRDQFPQQDSHNLDMIVIDTLLNFRKELEKYDPEKITLFAFLRMAVRGDMLNLIDKNRRQEQRLVDLDDPAIENSLPQADSVEAHFELDEWLQQHTDLSRQELLEALANELDNTDREILLLMLEGVRATTEYAEVMGIGYQDEVDQRREVKRAKDRIIKKLQRFGQRMSKS